jgi:hypothetical protein
MSRNFTADVDTQREYFNATYFNNSGLNQIARYDTTLLKPFFNDPDKWKLAINRMRVPLSGIPLTRNNIPFEQWEVGLYYQTDDEGAGQQEDFQFVPQINPKVGPIYDYINLSTNFNSQDVNIQPTFNVINESTIANINYNIQPAFESSNNIKTFYILDNDLVTVNVYQNNSNTVVATFSNPTPISGQTFNNLAGFCTDLSGNFYYCYFNTVNGSSPTEYYINIQSFTRTGASTWAIGLNYNLSPNYVYTSLGEVDTMFVYNGDIIVYVDYPPNQQSNPNTFYFAWNIGTAGIAGDGQVTTNKWVSLVDSNWIYRTDSAGTFTVSNGLIYNYTHQDVYCDRFLGFDASGNLLIHRLNQFGGEIGYQAFNAISGVVVYSFTPTNGSYGMLENGVGTIPIDSGPADIFTYQAFLNQINLAFQTSFNNLKNTMGSTFQPTEPPSIIYNAQTRLFNLIVEGQYLIKNSDGSNQYKILFNLPLWNKFYFPSNAFSPNYQEIILQNYGINAIVGTGSNTTPQFIYIQQEDSTIYAFYDLVRIIVGTTRIPVSGDGEGRTFSNTGSVSNSAINMITDIVPDTTTLTPGSVLIYIPAGILRWYNMYAQQPFDKVDLILYYETKDGNIYPIDIINGEFFSVKLEWKKGPGDF